MITFILASLIGVSSPPQEMPGLLCDEVAYELMEYNKEFNAFTVEEIEDLIGGCEGWEERYEAEKAEEAANEE